jgi:alpha-amylase
LVFPTCLHWMAPRTQVQRYADDTFYAFTRGTTFVAMTNVGSGGATQQRTITYMDYPDGTRLCNL